MKPERQYGTVLVFKQGMTSFEIEEAMKKIADILDGGVRIQSFKPEYGWPVFYIP
jgi:hypothetical protein